MRLILFQRDQCKLCDEALALLAAARAPEFESVWIDDDAALEARYGERVPVLREDDAAHEMDWPFDREALQRFFAARTPSPPNPPLEGEGQSVEVPLFGGGLKV